MSQKLLDHSPDLKRLQDDGFELEIKGALALVHHIPYVNSNKEIIYGTLVSELTLAGDATIKPSTHVIHFIGDHPCDKHGQRLMGISHQSISRNLGENVIIQHSFSNKPSNGYQDYYQKFVQYITVISSHAISLNQAVTAQTYFVPDIGDDTVFCYKDTNSGRAAIGGITDKLKSRKIGIIGLGGTGSYVLDFVAKTPVEEIHLFDGDDFVQHNAFRAPGAPSIEELRIRKKKTDYYAEEYLKMHKHVIPHNEYLEDENLYKLESLDYVFICIDKGSSKKRIIEFLMEKNIPFIDVGIGLQVYEDTLLGQARVTIGTPGSYEKALQSINFSDEEIDEAYHTNIQIAEINALNACIAVIQWKKYCGFYQDVSHYLNIIYSINDGELINETTKI